MTSSEREQRRHQIASAYELLAAEYILKAVSKALHSKGLDPKSNWAEESRVQTAEEVERAEDHAHLRMARGGAAVGAGIGAIAADAVNGVADHPTAHGEALHAAVATSGVAGIALGVVTAWRGYLDFERNRTLGKVVRRQNGQAERFLGEWQAPRLRELDTVEADELFRIGDSAHSTKWKVTNRMAMQSGLHAHQIDGHDLAMNIVLDDVRHNDHDLGLT
jgi:hypothetical protein